MKLACALRRYSSLNLQSCQGLIRDKARQFDWGSYIRAPYLPSPLRDDFLAIQWFNQELTRTMESVREVSLAHSKLDFWLEGIDEVYKDRPRQEPTLICLHHAAKTHRIPSVLLKRLVDARRNELDSYGLQDVLQMEQLAENVHTILILMNLRLLQVDFKNDMELIQCAEYMGRAVGIMDFIRRVPYNLRQYKLFLPQQLLNKHSITVKTLWDRAAGRPHEDLNDVILECAAQAKLNLEKAQEYNKRLPPQAFRAFLQGVELEYFLENLQKANFDIFDKSMNTNSYVQLPTRLFRAARNEQFSVYASTRDNPQLK